MKLASNTPEFDEYADEYDRSLIKGISVSGESKEHFARERIRWLHRCLGPHAKALKLLDYGCGTGGATPFFFEELSAETVVGVDMSPRSIAVAREIHGGGNAQFHALDDYKPDGSIDLVYCNGVFHHIPVRERAEAVRFVCRCLKPGGMFALWENNPWNPGTHLVMRRIPFDKDAVKVFPRVAVRLMHENGFKVQSVSFAFIFPRWLRGLRPWEPRLSRWPIGAQYQVFAQKAW